MEQDDIVRVRFDQCQVGLVGRKTGLPIKKRTELWASDETLIEHLRRFVCDGSHQHCVLEDKYKTHVARLWPGPFAAAIASAASV